MKRKFKHRTPHESDIASLDRRRKGGSRSFSVDHDILRWERDHLRFVCGSKQNRVMPFHHRLVCLLGSSTMRNQTPTKTSPGEASSDEQ
jgi:hypothetical protein